jgi:8-amino-7-oxononanoate synthase/acyl carrier protein
VKLEHLFEPFDPPETNLVERLRYWTAAQPDDMAFRYLSYGGTLTNELTYKKLDLLARSIAAQLVSMGMKGQRALLMYPPGLEFVTAFFGCHYAGVTPVPAYPPRRNRNMGRINAISEDAQAAIALTIQEVIERSDGMLDDSPSLRRIPWLATENVPIELASDWVRPEIKGDELALIQYTSGSTGSPKGVMLTHDNLLANCRMITCAFELERSTEACSWLPLYHDMGLVGGVLNPLYFGSTNTLMSPVAFLARPIRWLRTISQYGCHVAGAPNFAYALCVEKVDLNDCEGIDLSNWKLAFNGAEPVRADVLEKFSKKFAALGFKHSSHYPCYGMAESTLLITGGDKFEEPVVRNFDKNHLAEHRVTRLDADAKTAHPLVGCGRVLTGESIAIVHPESRRALTSDEIGEIWVNSPSVGVGYWNKPKVTKDTFYAQVNDPEDDRNYLRTGDLGFMDEDGELFITGRLKDMIIVRGVNRYPQDIEATVEQCDPRLRSGGAAAFAVEHWDREHLVVVCEVERKRGGDLSGLLDKLRAVITQEHDLPPDAVVLVRQGSVPKTSSGKVQRHACRKHYIEKSLLVVEQWSLLEDFTKDESEGSEAESNGQAQKVAVDSEIAKIVVQQVQAIARERAKTIDMNTNIVVDLGLDSLERLEIARELENIFGGRFPDEVLQEIETIGEVTAAVEKYVGTKPMITPPTSSEVVTPSKVKGPIPESYYLLEKTPEYIRLQRTKNKLEESGYRNPFFSVHEGRIGNTTQIDGKTLISYASYNYLGLSGHPQVTKAAKTAIDEYGTSVSASRIVSGEKTIHKQLESEMAKFLGVEDVITFPGGHATNESVIGHLVGPHDLIIHDSLAHNSLVQGAELSGARRRPFDHNDWRQLDTVLEEIRRDYRRVLIVIEGLYSMDGDYPDLPRFVDVKNKHKCWLYVDEAHSIGTMGATGRGMAEMFNVDRSDVECWMGTLSKSFGSCGGFVGGKKDLIEYLRYTTPGYVFAAGMPPANVGAALGALRMLQEESDRVEKLQSNSRLFLQLAQEAGLDTGMSSNSPIIPIITGSSIDALRLSESLFENNINAQPILYPAVPDKEARIRIFMTAEHTEEQVRESVEVITREWHLISQGDAIEA